MSLDPSLRIPTALRGDVEQIFAFTDGFCEEHLDGEYAALCRRLVAKLARKRPSPLARGDLRVWAATAIYTVGRINFLFDRTQRPHLSGDDLAALTGVAKSTMANKSGQVCRLLRIGQLEPELCRRDLLERHPFAWLVDFDGLIIDARALPPPLQQDAAARGLIPALAELQRRGPAHR